MRNENSVQSVIRLLPLLLFMAVIFFLSHQPGKNLPQIAFIHFDKVAHIIEYGILALLFLYGFQPNFSENSRPLTFLTIAFCLLYGMSDEFHQSFIPYRESSLFDVAADGIGAILASILWRRF